MRTLALSSFCVLVLVGCGDSVDNDPTGAGGAGGSGSGSGGICGPFLQEPEGSEVTVRLVNETANVIYLGDEQPGCSSHIPFEVLSDGQSLQWRGENCSFRCKDVVEGPIGCPAECSGPEATRIEPGSAYEVPWKGTILVSEEMPAVCFQDGEAGEACLVEQDAPPDLTLRAYAWTDIVCEDIEPACGCSPDASGVCTVSFATVTGTDLVATASLAVVSSTTVELIFTDGAQR